MAVMIRLQRTGKRDAASYRVVAVEKHSKRDGKTLSLLGFYNPNIKPALIQLNKAEIDKFIKNILSWISVKNGLCLSIRNTKKFINKLLTFLISLSVISKFWPYT